MADSTRHVTHPRACSGGVPSISKKCDFEAARNELFTLQVPRTFHYPHDREGGGLVLLVKIWLNHPTYFHGILKSVLPAVFPLPCPGPFSPFLSDAGFSALT